MKKTLLFTIAILLSVVLYAQHPNGRHPVGDKSPKPAQIENLVSDLSQIQKKKLNSITTESRKRVEKMQNELNSIRQQIQTLMDKDGDNSAKLFPLLDREGALKTEITKEMYLTRLKIDEVLSPDQLKELRAKLEVEHNHHKKHPHRVH